MAEMDLTEAIEDAGQCAWEEMYGEPGRTWKDATKFERNSALNKVTPIIEAAAPFIAAQALRDRGALTDTTCTNDLHNHGRAALDGPIPAPTDDSWIKMVDPRDPPSQLPEENTHG